jgi:hypothetical protein
MSNRNQCSCTPSHAYFAVFASILLSICNAVRANSSCDAPRGFDGRAYFVIDSQRQISESIKIEITNQNKYGIFSGTFSRYSPFSGRPEVLCQESVGVPLEGYYELSLHIKQSEKHSLCRDYDLRLTRRSDGRLLVEEKEWHIELTAICPD